MSPRGVYERSPRVVAPPKACDVGGCDRPARTARGALCEMHYYRTRRPDPSIRRRAFMERASKMRSDYERGMSTTDIAIKFDLDASQVSRWLRRVGTQMRPFVASGEDHPMWGGDAVSYSGAHMRVRAIRGSARDYNCPCGKRAAQWAYRHDDPAEIQSATGAYSPNPEHYDPMCVSCHKKSDLARLS